MSLVVLRHFDAYALLKKDKLALCGKISQYKVSRVDRQRI
jgi:hypothetical protein